MDITGCMIARRDKYTSHLHILFKKSDIINNHINTYSMSKNPMNKF